MLINGEASIKDIFYYFQGNLRYKIYYYPKLKWLLRRHIIEQIDYRIRVMRHDCYEEGSCVKCGCMTTQLQMCNKSCKGDCYPPLLSKIEWNIRATHFVTTTHNKKKCRGIWIWNNKKYKLLKEIPTGYVQTTNFD